MNEEISSIISLIKEANIKNKISVKIPSSEKPIYLIPLTTSHQKTFVQNLLDSPLVNTLFTVTSSKALSDCWFTEENGPMEPDKLTIVDRCLMLKNLLIYSYDTENHKKYKELLKSQPEIEIPEKTILNENDMELELFFPSILKEAKYAQYINEWVKTNLNTEDASTIHQLNSILYISDTLQYIKKIKIADKELDFDSIPVETQMEIGLSLSSAITEKIISIISKTYTPIVKKSKQLIDFTKKDENGEYEIIPFKLENAEFVIN